MNKPKLLTYYLIAICGLFVACGSDSDDDKDNNKTPSQPLQLSAAFLDNCAVCHGKNGEGISGPKLYGHDESLDEFKDIVRNGKSGEMPSFSTSAYSDKDLEADFNAFKQ